MIIFSLVTVSHSLYKLFSTNILYLFKKLMDSSKNFKIRCDHSLVIDSILDSIKEITIVLQHTPVVVL